MVLEWFISVPTFGIILLFSTWKETSLILIFFSNLFLSKLLTTLHFLLKFDARGVCVTSVNLFLCPVCCSLFFFPTPPSNSSVLSGHWLNVLQIECSLTLSTWRQHQVPQIKGLVPYHCPCFRCHLQVQVICASDQLTVNQRFPWPFPLFWIFC